MELVSLGTAHGPIVAHERCVWSNFWELGFAEDFGVSASVVEDSVLTLDVNCMRLEAADMCMV